MNEDKKKIQLPNHIISQQHTTKTSLYPISNEMSQFTFNLCNNENDTDILLYQIY